MVKNKLRGLALLRISWSPERPREPKQRINGPKTAWSNGKSAIFGLTG